MSPPPARDRGQAAVELALALPVVVTIVLGVVQVVAVVGDRLAVELAAREGARAAADRSTGLAPLDVRTSATSGRVTVTVRYRSRTDVPLVGGFIGDVVVEASASMVREPP